jgi:hypothetical protein
MFPGVGVPDTPGAAVLTGAPGGGSAAGTDTAELVAAGPVPRPFVAVTVHVSE